MMVMGQLATIVTLAATAAQLGPLVVGGGVDRACVYDTYDRGGVAVQDQPTQVGVETPTTDTS
jgi:hypothetical protein